MKGIFWILLFVTTVALLSAFNPWFPEWQRSGAVVLLVEVALIVLIVVPSVAYQALVRKKPWRESLGDSLRWVVDFLGGWA